MKMALSLSAPEIPRIQFATPRRIVQSTHQVLLTPKSQISTPKRLAKTPVSVSTPECFSHVTVETPSSTYKNRRPSKEKFDEIRNLTVAVRVRPMTSRELAYIGAAEVVQVRDQEIVITSSVVGGSNVSIDHVFQYDHVFLSTDEMNPLYANQEDVFLTLGEPLLNSAFRGYNACLFAYGQTGSGKSFSMMGSNVCDLINIDSEEFSGITPRFCKELFNRISALPEGSAAAVEVSYFEIYNEKIHDLLANENMVTKTALKVREHPTWGPYVVDLTVHNVKSYKDLRDWLLLGNKNRATAATTMNEKSSRSHSIFSIELCLSEGLSEGDNSRRSKVSLVDLAGSERLSNSHNSEEKIKQGVSINKSLLTLGKVISALSDQRKNQFVPYRDSVLTWLLRESLGGNSLTSMLATITPANSHVDETLATLRYACQARSIINRARINENPHDRLIRELRSEVERLRALRKSYERTSIGSLSASGSLSSLHISDTSNVEELDDLRHKLTQTESKLVDAEKLWEQKFTETKESQLKQLAESEKRREELESKVRIMKTMDSNIELSPYKTNFLEELEDVLDKENDQNMTNNENFETIKNWCLENALNCTTSRSSLLIVDYKNNKQTVITQSDFQKLKTHSSVGDFLRNLTWNAYKTGRHVNKTEIISTMNQIYKALSNLVPPDDEENLSLLYAKVSKSIQKFESALLSTVTKNGQKGVTFNI